MKHPQSLAERRAAALTHRSMRDQRVKEGRKKAAYSRKPKHVAAGWEK